MTFKYLTISLSNKKGGYDGVYFGSSLKIMKGDITEWFIDGLSDAIVNPTSEIMHPWGGYVNEDIHRAAGPELHEACFKLSADRLGVRCPKGGARITRGFKLRASHVIHTVGPFYGIDDSPEACLRSAYRNRLSVAKANNIEYIAFPALSCGLKGYPYDEGAKIAISTVKEFAKDFKEVHFVLFMDDIYNIWLKKAKELLQA